jgi:hypothetical protein
MYATPAGVDTVLIAGKVLKRGGKLQGVDYAALMREAEASADYLYSQSKMDPRPASYALQAWCRRTHRQCTELSTGPPDWQPRAPGNKGRAPRKLHKSTPTKRMKNNEFLPLNF